jgi:hypothetical protein
MLSEKRKADSGDEEYKPKKKKTWVGAARGR